MCAHSIIYYIERSKRYFDAVKKALHSFGDADYVTSVITVGEYLTSPYRENKKEYREAFYKFLELLDVELISVDVLIADSAARIRAGHLGFKLMDAIQIATAAETACDAFFTNDKQLQQYKELEIIVVEDFTS